MSKGYCDGHGCERNDVRSCGRDANGDADAPDLCFLCRKEAERGRSFDRKQGRYVRSGESYHEVLGEVACTMRSARVLGGRTFSRREIQHIVRCYGKHLSRRLRREMVDSLDK